MHGILTALRACLPGCQITSEFVTRLNRSLTKTTRTMLLLLSGRRSDEDELVNASFADMGVAIESLLRGENADDGEDVATGKIIGRLAGILQRAYGSYRVSRIYTYCGYIQVNFIHF
jgi:hypothetical protein